MLDKMRKKEGKTDRTLKGQHAQSILTQHSNSPLQLNTCAYAAKSLKSSILNLYDRCPHKLCHKYIPLGMLAGGSDTVYIKRRPN